MDKEEKCFVAEANENQTLIDPVLTRAETLGRSLLTDAGASGKLVQIREGTGERPPGENGGDENDVPFMFEQTPPFVKNGEMRPYQVRGLNWLIQLHHHGVNGILADEMGLGKTLQTIALLGYLKHYRGIARPFLIVAPKTTLENWANEFAKWCPSIQTVVLIGDKGERKAIFSQTITLGDFEVLITSYEMVNIESRRLRKIDWQYVIVDEAHHIKNKYSILSQKLRALRSNHRLLLTGTPLQNNIHEFWALLNFLHPETFTDPTEFESAEGDALERLHAILNQFLLRRLKSDVERALLPKKELTVFVQLAKFQREWYRNLLSDEIEILNIQTGKVTHATLLNKVMQLRKCCNHPYLFPGAEPDPPYNTDEHLIESCAKMAVLDKLLRKLKQEGSRVLLFSQFVEMLDIFERYCSIRGWKYCRLDGDTNYELRQQAVDDFNSIGSEEFLFLLSTRAGGVGINLASADVVVLYDSDWNPHWDCQAMDRCHRIGQTKQVRVFRLVTEGTVEEYVMQIARRKLRLDHVVLQQAGTAAAPAPSDRPGTSAAASAELTKANLMEIMQKEIASSSGAGTDAKGGKLGEDPNAENIESILKRAEQKTAELNELMAQEIRGLEEGDKIGGGDYSLYQFEGEDYREKLQKKNQEKEAEPIFLEEKPIPKLRPRTRVNYNEKELFNQLFGEFSPDRKRKSKN